MVDEKDRYDDEEEYHFTDDQVNYDLDAETPQGTPASPKPPGSFLTKLTPRVKAISAGIVFVILMTIILRMMVPATPPTEFAETKASQSSSKAEQKAAASIVAENKKEVSLPAGVTNPSLPAKPNENTGAQTIASTQNREAGLSASGIPTTLPSEGVVSSPASVSANAALPTAATPGMPASIPSSAQTQYNMPANPSASPPSSPLTSSTTPSVSNEMPVNQPLQSPSSPPLSSTMGQEPLMNNTTPPPVAAGPSGAPAFPNEQNIPMVAANPNNIMQRLSALEQQNAAIMNLLQTEYSQKLTDSESENTQIRGKMDEITKRVNRMEAALTQITQLLQSMNKPQPTEQPIAVRAVATPHMTYSVQAIIPGRAWLKSEAGDTITVAEGDVLRDYGRITKIDPYDGIVNIDVGNKIITLSYGSAE